MLSRNTDAPKTHDWTGHGRTNQELAAGPKTGYETPAEFHQTGERYGELYGAAQVPTDDAFGDASGPIQRIKGGSKVRKCVLKAKSLYARMPARQRIKTRRSRKSAASAHVSILKQRLEWLESSKLPVWQQRLEQADGAIRTLRSEFAALPFVKRASSLSTSAVVAIGVIVVAYDVVILRAALEHAGFGLHGWTLLYAVIATPLALMAVNTVMGVVAGAVALHVPTRSRLQLAVICIIAGGGALIATFALLALFRAETTSTHAGLLHALEIHANHPKLIVVPWWFAPLQLAGSIIAIASVAMYAAGEQGRDLRKLIAEEKKKAKELQRKCADVEEEIERTRREVESATVAVHEIDVDADAAEIEVQTTGEVLRAELEAEDGLEESVIGSFRTFYAYAIKIFQNGRVWRVALPTIARHFNRFYTPPPGDAEKSAEPVPSQDPTHHNGDAKLSPEEQKRLARTKKPTTSDPEKDPNQ